LQKRNKKLFDYAPRLPFSSLSFSDRRLLIDLQKEYFKRWGRKKCVAVQIPGRIEIIGNHLDHNAGTVIAAAIDSCVLALASKRDSLIQVASRELQKEFTVQLGEAPNALEGNTERLIYGMVLACQHKGYHVGGFHALVHSAIIPGAGLSSSAAFTLFVGLVISVFYNEGRIPLLDLAYMAQYSEHVYMGKDSGLMDQLVCAYGGTLFMDFKTSPPSMQRLSFNIGPYLPCVLITNEGHEHMQDKYTCISQDMKALANVCGAKLLGKVNKEQFRNCILRARDQVGDQACLRGIHFFSELSRVQDVYRALESGNTKEFLTCIRESSSSSWRLLQNVYDHACNWSQELALFIALSELFFQEYSHTVGVCRVHGGGFSGSVLAFIQQDFLDAYRIMLEQTIGRDVLHVLTVRDYGAVVVALSEDMLDTSQ